LLPPDVGPLIRSNQPAEPDRYQHCEHIARVLLHRYGIVFRKLLDQEDNSSPCGIVICLPAHGGRGRLPGAGRFVQASPGSNMHCLERLTP